MADGARPHSDLIVLPWPPQLSEIHRPARFAYRHTRSPVGGTAKRVVDIALSGAALLALMPLLLLVAILIRLETRGPALFRQRRGGYRGRAFQVLKFRTMRAMDDGRAVRQAFDGDPRITRVGRFLRRTSIDELPQLINVLLGEMSLVGPRPHALAHDDAFWLVDHNYPARFLARPGITGLAQVRGCRGLSDTPEKVQARVTHDLEYVRTWSLRRDGAIMLRTVRVLAGDANAC